MAKCYNCGKEGIPEEAKFCPSCGKSLKVTDELIKKALDGNQDALSELYYRTYQSVYGRIRAKVSDDDTALDLVQDTYLQVFSKLDQIKEPEAFPGWVLRIARNVTVDWYRKHGKDKDTELFSQNEYMDDDDFSSVDEDRTEYRTEYIPEAALDKEETARLLDEILNDLPEEQRLVLVMRYYDEMSLSEISQELDVNINTVKTRLSRGQKKVEERVRLLERRGTKLYSLAPVGFLLLLLKNEEAQAQTIPASDMFNAISAKAVAANAAGAAVAGKLAAGAGTKTAGATVGKSAAGVAVKAAAVKTVAVVAVSAVAVGGVAVGVKKASVPDVVTFNTQYEDYTDFTMGTTVNAAVADDYDDGELYTSDTLELAVYGNEDILREDILTITFLNGLSDVPDDAWDPTEDGAGSVMAWVEESDTEGMYDLYIAG